MICLVCSEKMMVQTNWTTVLYPSEKSTLCMRCEQRLRLLQGEKCDICSRESHLKICPDCEYWKTTANSTGDSLKKNISLYAYNPYMKDLVANWKYRGDYLLGTVFAEIFSRQFHEYFKDIAKHAAIVPIPLSEERLLERGFNQANMLAAFLTDDIYDNLTRIHSEKQAKKTRNERLTTVNPFKLRRPINKTVILVDDIYTTGRTLRHAAHILQEHGCPEVYAYTLIRG